MPRLPDRGTTGSPTRSLAGHAVRGAAWLTIQMVLLKVVGVGSQLIVAWFLARRDFGLFGLAGTAVAFSGLLQQAGLREVLLHRSGDLRRWANPAFWMAATFGALTAALLVATAPLVGRAYHSPELPHLIYVLALVPPVAALSLVPGAQLEAALRFKEIALIGLLSGLLTSGLTIVFAARGFGALSFAWPRVIAAIAQAIGMWWLAPVKLRPAPQLRRWKRLIPDSGYVLGVSFLNTMVAQGDYMLLGVFRTPEIVGVYYFAYTLSTQTIQLLTSNLTSVLYPILVRLRGEQDRQLAAFFRLSRLLGTVAIPTCFIQAILGSVLIPLFYGSRWRAAIGPFQLLSAAMALLIVGGPSTSLFQAQGRFRDLFLWGCGCAAIFLTLVGIAAACGGAELVATAVLVFSAICGPLGTYLAIGSNPQRARQMSRTFLLPFFLTAITIGPVVALSGLASHLGHLGAAATVLGVILMSSVYATAMRLAMPEQWAELASLTARVAARLRTVQPMILNETER